MCGFLTMGSTEVEIDVFDEALGKIEGRGPDMIETSRLFDKTFGFNRLAIMDLEQSFKLNAMKMESNFGQQTDGIRHLKPVTAVALSKKI